MECDVALDEAGLDDAGLEYAGFDDACTGDNELW